VVRVLPSKRISLECPVANPVDVRDWAYYAVLSARATIEPPSDYHLTVLYLGRPDEIFRAVQSAASDRVSLNEAYFLDRLRNWLRVHVRTLRHRVAVAASGLVTLGPAEPYALACRISFLPPEVSDLHEGLLSSFATFLNEELGVSDGLGFMGSSPVFGYSGKSWVPHITVGRSRVRTEVNLPPLEVGLGPLRVRNGEVLGLLNSEPV